MNWENFYLTCFFAGLLLTVVSFLFGAHFHLPVHVHFPNGFHLPHLSVHHGGGHGDSVSPLNLTTILMFVTWFGATGFLIAHYHSGGPALALMVSIAVGFAGGALMYLFTLRVFVANEHPLRDADFDMTGVLGRVSVPIRPSGTGELIYAQQGTRRSCGARTEDGSAIDRGTEVIVLRYDKGIAYVRRWSDLQPDPELSA